MKNLEIAYDYDFVLIALNTGAKTYKLAWIINRELRIGLSKKENAVLDFTKGKKLQIVNYIHEDTYRTIKLLKNRAETSENQFNAFIIQELKHCDYFLILENKSDTFDKQTFVQKIKQLPFVEFVTQVDIKSLKSKDNLIF